MQALTLIGPSQFTFGQVADPEPAADEVLVRVRACGICGSDIHGMDGSSGRRQPPVIMGHEAAGDVVATGSAVKNWSIGQPVTFDSTVFCGRCPACLSGQVNLCSSRQVLGVSCDDYKRDGCFAELVALPQHILHAIPPGVSHAEAAFAEPISVALHAVNRLPATPRHAVVVGTGLIGLLVVQALRRAGCPHILAIDRDPARLELARRFGAADTLQPDSADAAAWVHERTDGGADAAFEVVGHEVTLDLAIHASRIGGAVVLVGNLSPRPPFALQAVVTGERTLHGSCASAGEYPDALAAVADGSIQVQPLLSARAPLADGEQWFARLAKGEPGLMKVVLEP